MSAVHEFTKTLDMDKKEIRLTERTSEGWNEYCV